MSTEESEHGRSKVDRLLGAYDLDGIGAELESRWTATEDRSSLRDLADYFNRRLLRSAMDEAGVSTISGEVENTYRLLTDEGVSGADRTRIRRRLERAGVPVDSLLDDFVSYQAVRTYLTKHREVAFEPSEDDPLERDSTNIRKLRGRTVSVTESKLDHLRTTDELHLGQFRTLVDVRVVCEECGGQFDVVELLDRGRCDCPVDG